MVEICVNIASVEVEIQIGHLVEPTRSADFHEDFSTFR
jgi:hypothetical protein